MILDRDKRFIFVHNPRTGGTSIVAALRKYHDDKVEFPIPDVYTQMPHSHPSHLPIVAAPRAIRDKYNYSFTCVRNPYARTYSYYTNLIRGEQIKPTTPFSLFVTAIENQNTQTAPGTPGDATPIQPHAFYTISQRFWTTGVDEVIRMEDLQSLKNWKELMDKCGIKEEIDRPHENQTLVIPPRQHQRSHEPYARNYRTVYTDYMRSQIATIFKEDIETYGYEF